MTASIPNGFSEDQLRELMNQAASREEADKEAGPYNGLTRQEICHKAEAALDAMNDICKSAVCHKLVVMQIIHNYIEWHNAMGNRLIEEGQNAAAAGWFRDAGKFQAIGNLLEQVSVDQDDFTTAWYDSDSE